MGCSASQNEPGKDQLMTAEEKDMLKNSWASVLNRDELGIQIMFRIFKTHEEIKYLWIFASNLETEEEMLRNSQFCYHAKKLGDSINTIVLALTSTAAPNEITEYIDLIRLGRRHFRYGVQESYYKCFEDCLIFALKKCSEPKIFTNTVKKAWRKAIAIMFIHFGEGLKLEMKETEEQDKLENQMKRKPNLL